MNCRTVSKRIPDFVNGTLSAAKNLNLERHLETCRECRKDTEIYRAGLLALKKPDVAGEIDFTEDEWAAVMRAATDVRPAKRTVPAVRRLRPAFGYALGVLLVGAAVLIGVRRFPWLIPALENRPAAEGTAVARPPEIVETIPSDSLFTDSDLWAEAEKNIFSTAGPSSLPSSAPSPAAGDVPSFTWISPDSGLQIVWFVTDNIQMEE